MVPLGRENAYDLRQHLAGRALAESAKDPFKRSWSALLSLGDSDINVSGDELTLYERCAIDGLGLLDSAVLKQDLLRLLGQSATIDSTPRPWVSDVFGVMAIKWLVDRSGDKKLGQSFKAWCSGFLPQQMTGKQFNVFEHDIAAYINNSGDLALASAAVPLFLHYRGLLRIDDHRSRSEFIARFMREFRGFASQDWSPVLTGLIVYVFDNVNNEVDLVPPNGWVLDDLVKFLEHIPIGLKKWTWEDVPRTRNGAAIKWHVENEYHVQNLLYVLLAPIFNDLKEEEYLESLGQKTPRIDLYLPTMHTIIEVKFRKEPKKSFADLIGEVAEDSGLYRSDERYKDARFVVFLWDHTRATEEHTKFREGVMRIPAINACVVVSSPSMIQLLKG